MKQDGDLDKIESGVAEFYESHGAEFGVTRRYPWGVMHLVLSYLKSGTTLIDVGAGNARLAEIVPDDISYIAIEPSSSLRRSAFHRYGERRNVKIVEGGFPRLPVSDETAQVVACFAVIHHLVGSLHRKQAILELWRILKPGGTLILTVWNLRSQKFFKIKTWLAAWLRLPLVRGGGWGDVMIPWNYQNSKATAQSSRGRYVHCFTKRELSFFFDKDKWTIEKLESFGNDRPEKILKARNLLVIARKR